MRRVYMGILKNIILYHRYFDCALKVNYVFKPKYCFFINFSASNLCSKQILLKENSIGYSIKH